MGYLTFMGKSMVKHVVVAMSGGVDSSVAAALLIEQGYEVRGITLKLWSEPGKEAFNRCCNPDGIAMAQRVAAQLGIPLSILDERDTFYELVVKSFIEGYACGITPNPCLECNRLLRFGLVLEYVRRAGADFLATGHYVRLRRAEDGRMQLLTGLDEVKDQSYVLSGLNQEQLGHALFPIGELSKTEVRRIARRLGLAVAERPDSQDLCFLGEDDYRDFLRRHAPQLEKPGPILNPTGKMLGQHHGLAFYTIGQRKGLGIASSTPLYVLEKDVGRNLLIVGDEDALGKQRLTTVRFHWISGKPPELPNRFQIKIRYKAQRVWGMVAPLTDGKVQIDFEEKLRDITPGQAAVIYDNDLCLGRGIIEGAS